jgi:hypothetical protein
MRIESICFWEWNMDKYEFADGNPKIIQIFQIIGFFQCMTIITVVFQKCFLAIIERCYSHVDTTEIYFLLQ